MERTAGVEEGASAFGERATAGPPRPAGPTRSAVGRRRLADPAGSLSAPARLRRHSRQGAAHRARAPTQHMRVDLGGADILVSEKLLHRADVVTRFEQMGRKRVPVMPNAALTA